MAPIPRHPPSLIRLILPIIILVIVAMAIAMVVIMIVVVFLAFVRPVLFPLLFLYPLLRFVFFFSSFIPRTPSGLLSEPCSPSRVFDELRLRLRPVTGPPGS
jgi:hypothetical protein